MKVSWRKFFPTVLAYLCTVAVFVLALLPAGERKPAAAERQIVRVWHIDTFEGGKGSRLSFLKSAARRAEAGREGVYYLVVSYTAEGAEAAMKEGNFPDAVSFGIGLSAFAERALPLPYAFAGGELKGKTRACPWCRGGYALFSLEDAFEEEGSLAVSSGGSNLPEVAAALAGLKGEVLPSLEAYTAFLGGKYRYLLGTQRDLNRFAARGTAVYYRPLPAFCDLYQYYSVLSAEKREPALALLEELLSERTQGMLSSVGMYPAEGDGAFALPAEKTVSPFASPEALREMRELAAEDGKILEKYLKSI